MTCYDPETGLVSHCLPEGGVCDETAEVEPPKTDPPVDLQKISAVVVIPSSKPCGDSQLQYAIVSRGDLKPKYSRAISAYGTNDWVHEGEPFYIGGGDIIETNEDSAVTLYLPASGAIVDLEPNTIFEVPCQSEIEARRRAKLNQGWGEFFIELFSGQSFEVEAKNAIAGSKGTHFIIDGRDPQTTKIQLIEGELDITPINPSLRPFVLKGGEEVGVSENSVSEIRPLLEQNKDNEESGRTDPTDTEAFESLETISDSQESPTIYTEDTRNLIILVVIIALVILVIMKKITIRLKIAVLLVLTLLIAIGAVFFSGGEKAQPTPTPLTTTSLTIIQAPQTTSTTTLPPLATLPPTTPQPQTTLPPETSLPTTIIPTTTTTTLSTITTTSSTTTSTGPESTLEIVEEGIIDNVDGNFWLGGKVRNNGDSEALSVRVRLILYNEMDSVMQILNSVPIDRIGPGDTVEFNVIKSDKIKSAVARYEVTILSEG